MPSLQSIMPATMNQQFDLQSFSLVPDHSRLALEATLAHLLVPGNIMDARLESFCRRLQQRYNIFLSTCPVPEWREGLIISAETRWQTEKYLPIAEIQHALCYLLSRACRYEPFYAAVPVFTSLSWIDALDRLTQLRLPLNPARIIAAAAADQTFRFQLLSSFFVPKRYGGAFDRYPLQQVFLGEWLSGRKKDKIVFLDAACGAGDGVYALWQLSAGLEIEAEIHGSTVEPLELVAAAHGWFPVDHFRETCAINLIKQVNSDCIRFYREDICDESVGKVQYDVLICNGLLGGPLMHDDRSLKAGVKGLAMRLKKGGLVLAANRFHGGWHRTIPSSLLENLFVSEGLKVIPVQEGVGAIKT